MKTISTTIGKNSLIATTVTILFVILLNAGLEVKGQCGPFQIYESFGTAALPTQGGTWLGTSMTFNTSGVARTGVYVISLNAANDAIRTPMIANPGVFSFWYKRSGTSATLGFAIETSPDNVTWTSRATYSGTMSTSYVLKTVDLGALSLTNVYVRIKDTRASGTTLWYIDDMSWTSTVASNNTVLIQGTGCSPTIDCGTTYTVYDRGGVNDEYSISQTSSPMVISSSTVGGIITVNISSLGTELNYDYLKM